MTFLGKIFTVIILLMSIVYMSFAICVFATHKNWKEIVMRPEATGSDPQGLKFQVEAYSKRNKELVEELGRVKQELSLEKAARRHALASVATQLQEAEELLGDSQRLLPSKDDELKIAIANADRSSTTLATLTKEVALLRGEILDTTLDRDKQFTRVVTLNDELHNAVGVKDTLTNRNRTLAEEASKMQRVMTAHGIKKDDPIDDAPPSLDGVITAVDASNYVEISIGGDDGIRKGNTLEVFRNNAYLGRVVVKKVASDAAVAEIIPEYSQGKIRVNDRVATRIRS